MKFFNKLRTTQILTFPVETAAMVYDPKTNDIIDQEYKDFTAEMYAEGHSFFTYISDSADSLSSCCRLRNQLTTNTFSPTSGLTGIMTGSVNVITLNINRIIQDWAKRETTWRSTKGDKNLLHCKDNILLFNSNNACSYVWTGLCGKFNNNICKNKQLAYGS